MNHKLIDRNKSRTIPKAISKVGNRPLELTSEDGSVYLKFNKDAEDED